MKIAQINSVYISVPPKTHGGTGGSSIISAESLLFAGIMWSFSLRETQKLQCELKLFYRSPAKMIQSPHFILKRSSRHRNTYNLYRQAERFDVIHAHWTTLACFLSFR